MTKPTNKEKAALARAMPVEAWTELCGMAEFDHALRTSIKDARLMAEIWASADRQTAMLRIKEMAAVTHGAPPPLN
jgi:hypothetical protein